MSNRDGQRCWQPRPGKPPALLTLALHPRSSDLSRPWLSGGQAPARASSSPQACICLHLPHYLDSPRRCPREDMCAHTDMNTHKWAHTRRRECAPHTDMCRCTHRSTHTCTRVRSRVEAFVHADAHARAHTRTHIHARLHSEVRHTESPRRHAHAHVCARSQACTHTHAHIRTGPRWQAEP